MADSKKYNGSTWQHSLRKLTTDTDTLTTLPAVLYPNDTTATVGSKGNMVQNGTPSPQNPVMPNGCGNMTGNLFPLDESKLHIGRIENDGTIDYQVGTLTVGTDSVTYEANTTWRGFYTDFIQANENKKLTFSPNNSSAIVWSCNCYDENDNFLGKASAQSTASIRIFTLLTGTKKVRMSVTCSSTEYTISQPMLNTGSTALPYEPYGVKIPISSASTTTPVYLGEVETTRHIKKLVLTGKEAWQLWNGNYYSSVIDRKGAIGMILCTHFINSSQQGISYNNQSTSGLKIASIAVPFVSDLSGLKEYLAAQYAAGTPVTVWYVLATETTGIVNEPLMKIGDYADEVSNVSIPVTAGGDTISVGTTVQPSEITANYKGWHPVEDVHERDNGAWT